MIGFIDVDGTLGDTQTLAITEATLPVMRCFQSKALELEVTEGGLFCWKTGQPVTNQQFLDSIGSRSMIDMLMSMNNLFGNKLSEETLGFWDIEEAGAVIRAFQKPGALKPIPGAHELLSKLRRDYGVSMHAVSSSAVDRLCITLRGLRLTQLLDGIFSAQGDNGYYTDDQEGVLAKVHSVASRFHYNRPLPKPDPAVYHLACHLTGTAADKTFTVEDSTSGVEAARRANIGTIIGLTCACNEAEARALRGAGATHIVPKLMDALPIICDRFGLTEAVPMSA